jgi:hypothetical protein
LGSAALVREPAVAWLCLTIIVLLTSSDIVGYYALEVNRNKMVKQQSEAKTSSTRSSDYRVSRGEVVPIAWLPETANLGFHQDGTKFEISGTLRKDVTEEHWPEPPHIAFANLHVEDPQAVEAFVKRYGILHWSPASKGFPEKESNVGTREDILRIRNKNQQQLKTQIENAIGHAIHGSEPENRQFSVESFGLFLDQDHLWGVWEDAELVEELEAQIAVNVVIKRGIVELVPGDLWALICFLSVRDYKTEKLGVCENPDCPARYFRKNRRTQKFCEQGPCVAYAQRQYSLDWWNRVGKKKREKKKKNKRSK